MSDRITAKYSKTETEQRDNIQTYYQLQSKIYDLTRWTFLFGRLTIPRRLPFERNEAFRLLEIGCGTGYNLRRLARRFPNAELTGLDLSQDMLRIARRSLRPFGDRVSLAAQLYEPGSDAFTGKVDVILFSYALTMINPQWRTLLDKAYEDLPKGGVIAVTDFHDSRFSWFKSHMANHHVRMDSHLTPVLREQYEPIYDVVKPAYGGVWEYMVFIGRK